MIEKKMLWNDYTPVETASEGDVAKMESLVGLPFPTDYRELLLHHQGMILDESTYNLVEVHLHGYVLLDGIIPIKAKVERKNLNNRMESSWSAGCPRTLLYFARSSSQYFALDYFAGVDAPPSVVYVNSEAPDSDQELEEWRSGSDPLVRVYAEFNDPDPDPDAPSIVVFHVADSITDLLAMLVKCPDDM